MNLKEIAYSHYLPAKRKRAAGCKAHKGVVQAESDAVLVHVPAPPHVGDDRG